MGVGPKLDTRSTSSYDITPTTTVPSGNPDPAQFTFVRVKEVEGRLILWLKYSGCSNYEGEKILVYDNDVTLVALLNQRSLDCHFSNSKTYISPVARFVPTERGWGMAEVLCESYGEN